MFTNENGVSILEGKDLREESLYKCINCGTGINEHCVVLSPFEKAHTSDYPVCEKCIEKNKGIFYVDSTGKRWTKDEMGTLSPIDIENGIKIK